MGEMLIQKRQSNKKSWPNVWDLDKNEFIPYEKNLIEQFFRINHTI